ncbi:MAG: DUF4133 domain-containing protein [Solitalea-like symbiont of Acarus siro]
MREIHNCRFVSNPIKVRQLVGRYIIFTGATIIAAFVIVLEIMDLVRDGAIKALLIVAVILIAFILISIFSRLSIKYGSYGIKYRKILNQIHQIFN